MQTSTILKRIQQTGPYTFLIEWSDGIAQNFRLSDLQKMCPCANCVDEGSGRRILDQNTIREDVKARRIVNVGRYAIRIEFTSGCSTGIYSFDFLRHYSGENDD